MDPADEETFEVIKRRVETRMLDLNMNMKEVSLAAKKGETFVRDMLRRGRAPSAEALKDLAKVLKTSVNWLVGAPEGDAEESLPAPVDQFITVAEYDVRLSAGPGSLVEREVQLGTWQFSRRYVHEVLKVSAQNLAVVEVDGDSMEPTLRPGDRVLIDHSDRNPARLGIYAIWDSTATVVKRIEPVPYSDPPMVVLISDNTRHNQYTVPAELVNVIGRVVWCARRL